MTFAWTKEQDDRLTELWNAGDSAATIGAIFGTSRNSVIGRAHRLKLSSRASPRVLVDDRRRYPQRRRKPGAFAGGFNGMNIASKKTSRIASEQKETILGKGVPIEELESHHCRWIITDM